MAVAISPLVGGSRLCGARAAEQPWALLWGLQEGLVQNRATALAISRRGVNLGPVFGVEERVEEAFPFPPAVCHLTAMLGSQVLMKWWCPEAPEQHPLL